MYLLPSNKPSHFAPGLNPAAARRKYRKSHRTERLQASYHTRKRNHAVRVGWDRDEGEDGRRLASDPTVSLPGEHRRPTPRLERQEAFRAPQPWDISDTDVVVDDAELYRLGILYDDDQDGSEHVRGPGFCLDAIMRKEPVYSIRRAKRAKKTHDRRLSLREEDLHLSVELLSTYLGDDAAIARFFAPVGDWEPARLHYDGFSGTNLQQNSSTPRNILAEPLSIIYELEESSIHSLTPTAPEYDFSDLVSNKEKGYEEAKGDISYRDDWALVSKPDNDAGQSGEDTASLATSVEVITDVREEETADPVGGAWIILAGDDS
ncbi:hypothetical protein F4859DRAFT_510572 [Xylaria cf. heliscus]|nr:hypothetical protein F4859DRAFT_510572 [Xylaria cf. heliscus]